LTLDGTAYPLDATNRDIVWSFVSDVNDTEVVLDGDVLKNTAYTGTVVVCATIAHGTSIGIPYTQNFPITFSHDYKKFMVINLSEGEFATRYPITFLDDIPSGGWTDWDKTTNLVMRRIDQGTFTMGTPGTTFNEDEHQVTLTKDYYIGVFQITQKQWELVMGLPNYATHTGDNRPIEGVDYNQIRMGAGSFMDTLRTKAGLPGFDLPTEAQWERACRAGTATALNSGKNLTATKKCPNMAEVGRYDYNQNDGKGEGKSHTTVGMYLPNAWGLYDMHGNVWEWCLDWYTPTSEMSAVVDPKGPSRVKNLRVVRGGAYNSNAEECRSASRYDVYHSYYNVFRSGYFGFRVCLPLTPVQITPPPP